MKNGQFSPNISPDSPLTVLPGIGQKRAEQFRSLGIEKAGDLLRHFPRAYQDRGNARLLSAAESGTVGAFILTVSVEPRTALLPGGMKLTKMTVFDEIGTKCTVVFFNQPYLKQIFHCGDTFRFWGKMTRDQRGCELSSPQFEPVKPGHTLAPFVPVYPLTSGLTQNVIRSAIGEILAETSVSETLPLRLREKYALPSAADACRMIHCPQSWEEIEAAKKYFIYEDMYLFALGLSLSKSRRRAELSNGMSDTDVSPLLSLLPYELTGAQKRSISEIARDLGGEETVPRMSRMVTGDVGSGKTMVAAAAAYICVKNGYQCLLMAPTEILANQHYEGLRPLFGSLGFSVGLLTGSVTGAKKTALKERLAEGTVDFVIGTHALITPDVKVKNPGLVITDEQHRFGVAQRDMLAQSDGLRPHVLVMSATPIPRSLALVLYGDLELSQVDEMPPGRKKVDTYVVGESYRARLDAFIVKNVREGGQVYIVCPAVEAKEDDEEEGELIPIESNPEKKETGLPPLKNAVGYAAELKERLRDLRIEFVHGKMKNSEKDNVMNRFAAGEIDVLVSTTVIEVGVNVPNATLMIVENAERFGLSQLHQLRGRVGRGEKRSYCVLVSDAKGETAKGRLNMMKNESDGCRIAEYDLKQRGPGDFLAAQTGATRQHGMSRFGFLSCCDSMDDLKSAFEDAAETLLADPDLSSEENREASERIGMIFADGNS